MGLFGFGNKKETKKEAIIDGPKVKPKNLKDTDMDSIIKNSKIPVVVDCWAVWCQPCKAIAPIIADLATEYQERVLVTKLNTEKNRKMAAKYSIRSIPTILYFKNGKLVKRTVGALPKKSIKAVIENQLLK